MEGAKRIGNRVGVAWSASCVRRRRVAAFREGQSGLAFPAVLTDSLPRATVVGGDVCGYDILSESEGQEMEPSKGVSSSNTQRSRWRRLRWRFALGTESFCRFAPNLRSEMLCTECTESFFSHFASVRA
ncbi:hypothetical protein BHE74_00010895 [Ensete ventricosum]|nr:hypothetical protein BHE74_00010895 [Ensete ventricosum]RZS14810.1 hypothetical protein BHM03_00046551 [Ensete ventricosum]